MKTRYRLFLGIVLTCALSAWIGWYFLNHMTKPTDSRLQVVAAENFWGDIAQQIGGERVRVSSIMADPSVDPHMYASSAHDALLISQANLLIINGLGYDNFMDKLANAGSNKDREVVNVSNVLNVHGTNANPHLWYDLERIPVVATAFEKELATLDPSHAASYESNLRKFINSLQPLQAKQNAIAQQHSGAPVAYTERIPQYMLEGMGLSVKTPEQFAAAIEEGDDPSPATQNAMLALFKNKQVRVLLYNSQATSPVTEHMRKQAQQAGIPVIGVSETMPPRAHFQKWQLDQLNAIQNALQ